MSAARFLISAALLAACGDGGTQPDAGTDASNDITSVDVASDALDGGADVAADAPADVVTCDAQITGDPHNCGRCGHDCLGGACYQGVCSPVTIADNHYNSGAIVVDGTTLYWGAVNEGILTCPTTGCDGGVAQLYQADDYPIALTVDSNNAYWVGRYVDAGGSFSALQCSKPSCTTPIVLTPPLASSTRGLAVDGTDVYIGATNILKCAIGGCGGAPTSIGDNVTDGIADLVLDTSTIYFPYTTWAAVMSCPKTGCVYPTTLASSQPYAVRITRYGGEIFWVNGGFTETSGSIMRCDPNNCLNPTVVASGQLAPTGIAVDASGIYWVNLGTSTVQFVDSEVRMCPLSGCTGAPITLASAQQANGVALDANNVYYVAESSGAGPLKRVAKP
jgi:hypothetical protein